ncbi:MAG TPA: hypothetical protein PLD27_02980 [bacterium]|nr:hypothetical protein [bacterium]HOL47062.1 hypothetical protein [bacterium]HPQ17933.1 hypothetical protein [bacterium]
MFQKCLYVFLFIIVIGVVSITAAPRYGVAVNTTISNTATISAANALSQTAAYIDTTVRAVYGETTILLSTADTTLIGVGDSGIFYYRIYNTGNTSDSFKVQVSNLTYPNGASNWTVGILGPDSNPVNSPAASGQLIIGPIAEDGSATFAIRIVSSSNAAEASNDSTAYCTMVVTFYSNSFTGQYTGDNDTIYAINNTSFIFYETATISAAVFTITQICTGTTLGGAASNPIPGASLWYQITYNNTGSGAGNNVFLYVKIDTANVEYADTVAGSATGWTFYYTTSASPTLGYGSAGGWTAGAPDAATARNVTYIKWDKAVVAAAENGTLGYKVEIK